MAAGALGFVLGSHRQGIKFSKCFKSNLLFAHESAIGVANAKHLPTFARSLYLVASY
jgi:hypothetical protein